MFSDTTLLIVYHSLFHCHLSYGVKLWAHAAGCDTILIPQKKAERVITSAGRIERFRPIFNQIGLFGLFYGQYIGLPT